MYTKTVKLLLIFFILFEGFVISKLDPSFSLYFLDVGQGDAILIKTNDYKYILVDGGKGTVILDRLGEVLPFWITKIDIVIGTHTDDDHIGGLVNVVQKYDVGYFFINDPDAQDENLNKIKTITQEKNIKFNNLNSNNSIKISDLKIEILFPKIDQQGSDNEKSIVMRCDYFDFSFLLTGDTEVTQELFMIDEYDLSDIDVLKVAHHGSNSATSLEFLDEVTPRFAVISVGVNKFGHPTPETLEKLNSKNIKILQTKESGTIQFVYIGGVIHVRD